jgi:hypothetical protein
MYRSMLLRDYTRVIGKSSCPTWRLYVRMDRTKGPVSGASPERTSQKRTWDSTGKLRGMEWIDNLDGAGYSRGSALTGRLLPAAREASHLFSFSVSSYLLSAWYQRDTGKYERRLVTPSKFLRPHPCFESLRKHAKKLVRQFAAAEHG